MNPLLNDKTDDALRTSILAPVRFPGKATTKPTSYSFYIHAKVTFSLYIVAGGHGWCRGWAIRGGRKEIRWTTLPRLQPGNVGFPVKCVAIFTKLAVWDADEILFPDSLVAFMFTGEVSVSVVVLLYSIRYPLNFGKCFIANEDWRPRDQTDQTQTKSISRKIDLVEIRFESWSTYINHYRHGCWKKTKKHYSIIRSGD